MPVTTETERLYALCLETKRRLVVSAESDRTRLEACRGLYSSIEQHRASPLSPAVISEAIEHSWIEGVISALTILVRDSSERNRIQAAEYLEHVLRSEQRVGGRTDSDELSRLIREAEAALDERTEPVVPQSDAAAAVSISTEVTPDAE